MSPVSTRRGRDIANYLSADAHLFGGNMRAPSAELTAHSHISSGDGNGGDGGGATETKSTVIKLTQAHCSHILRAIAFNTPVATLPVKNHDHNANANPMKVECTFPFILPFIFHTRTVRVLECECFCYNKVWQKNVMCIKM